jgi:hypothetical protein
MKQNHSGRVVANREVSPDDAMPGEPRGIHSRSSRLLACHMAELAAAVANVAYGIWVSACIRLSLLSPGLWANTQRRILRGYVNA